MFAHQRQVFNAVKLPPLTGQFDLLESGRWTQ
jgi:hypothetical protein